MKYHFAEACQNTFILFDCLSTRVDESLLQKAYLALKEEKRDDALILTDGKIEGDTFYARMIVAGLDGTLGEFCGNGARACAAYLFEHISLAKKFFLVTQQGSHPLMHYDSHTYSIKLPPARFDINPKFVTDGKQLQEYGFCYVEMIEPHLTIKKKMSDEELLSIGRELNQQRDLFPHGINVNAWHLLNDGTLHVRTYERGVQRLTQSCGTGSMSCAACYKTTGSVFVSTPGGSLKVLTTQDGIELIGPAFFF